jgi:hypothetical protein
MRVLLQWVACVLCVLCALPAWSQPPQDAREAFQALTAVRADAGRTYYVRELVLRRDAVRIYLSEGKLAFLQPVAGKVTGAVFTGQGRVIAVPRDPIERRSLAHFVGTPLLDIPFARAFLRFTDDAARELEQQLAAAEAAPVNDPAFGREWDPVLVALNPWHSLRILTDWLSANPLPYFYAGVQTESHGPLDVMVDYRREEQVGIGQPRFVAGNSYYDLWTAFPVAGQEAMQPPFDPVSYVVDTTIHPDVSLEGRTTAEIKAVRGGEQMLSLELSRHLAVQSVTDALGRALVFFQNEEVNRNDIAARGNDSVLVALAEAPAAGDTFKLTFRYKGRVISDAGNGAYFVGARGIWYPNVGGFDRFAAYDMSFRWPRNLVLVANGKKISESEEAEWKTGRWISESPVSTSGFNLGNYESRSVQTDRFTVEVYANRRLETEMVEQLRRNAQVSTRIVMPGGRRPIIVPVLIDPIAPSPTGQLEQLAKEVEEAIRFNESLSVAFPLSRLAVAQIPGSFGQGWPGLLYLSTLSFLSPAAQARMGANERTQEQFLDLVPPHEVAHQWWGNLVGWSSYRDQWINEGLANYMALMFAESRKPGQQVMKEWLSVYRDRLKVKDRDSDEALAEAGPLVLGRRLMSSKSTAAYTSIIYGKGTWVLHMLRMMLRDEKAAEPDARFVRLLRTLATDYRHRALSTADLQREVEKLMTKEMDLEGGRSMDWFFDQWVYGIEIPRFSLDFKVAPQAKRFVVTGTLKQKDTAGTFIARVPLYAETARGRLTLLGTVVTSGEETKFRFTTGAAPRKLVIDPHQTVLAFTE